jgi:anti-sigma28 factor (negative regulator of flagellin synthesis)
MRIQNNGSTPSSASELNRTQSISSDARSYGSSLRRDVSLDRVDVSEFADQVLNLMDIESKQRTEHVEQLRQSYQAGTYRENPVNISRSMVSEALSERTSGLAF